VAAPEKSIHGLPSRMPQGARRKLLDWIFACGLSDSGFRKSIPRLSWVPLAVIERDRIFHISRSADDAAKNLKGRRALSEKTGVHEKDLLRIANKIDRCHTIAEFSACSRARRKPQSGLNRNLWVEQWLWQEGDRGCRCLIAPFCFATGAFFAQTPALDSVGKRKVDLTVAQKQILYQSIGNIQTNKATPTGFSATIGAEIPSGIALVAVPATIAELIPQTKGLETEMVGDQVFLVEPEGKTVVAVIALEL
jgi:hypothetical protein